MWISVGSLGGLVQTSAVSGLETLQVFAKMFVMCVSIYTITGLKSRNKTSVYNLLTCI